MIFSFICSALLFFPAAETLLVREHCHTNCGTHLPLVNSAYIAWPGIALLVGMLVLFVVRGWQQVAAAKTFTRQLYALSDKSPQGESRLLHDQTPLIFTVGFTHNTVFLSDGLRSACNDEELNIVFAHEEAHVKRKDNLRLLLARLFSLPIPSRVAVILHDDLKLFTESACDAWAAKRFDKFSVAETFLKIQRLVPRMNQSLYSVSSIHGADIENRVATLLNSDRLRKPPIAITTAFVVFGVGLLGACIDPLHHLIELVLQNV